MQIDEVQQSLCRALCADVRVSQRAGLLCVATPFRFADGDAYSIYLKPLPTGGFRVTDMGSTLMHMSYEGDVEKFYEGQRGRLLGQILAESNLVEDDGEFFMESAADRLGQTVFRFGQALTRLHDLNFLNRARVESTFYEDLRERLGSYVDAERIHPDFIVPDVTDAINYPVDFYIEGSTAPLYLFGVPNRDKARLATIILQHLHQAGLRFDSMVVFQDWTSLPKGDFTRVMNAANDMIGSLDAEDDFRRKLLRRVS